MCKFLLISGHGAGDPGAIGVHNGITYKEADLTRDMTERIQSILEQDFGADVERYPVNRNAYYDYMSNNLAVDLAGYHYVLEIHFNALKKDADGKLKGTEIFAPTARKDKAADNYILDNIQALGFPNRGQKKYDWAVISAAHRKGSPSALLEVCFIDDADDMKLFLSRKQEIAEAIAEGIAEGFFLERRDNGMRYADVKADAWYAEAVETVSELGIMEGSNGKFRPNDPVTRAELATVIARTITKLGGKK